MRKLLGTVVSLAVVLGLLAGCGSAPTNQAAQGGASGQTAQADKTTGKLKVAFVYVGPAADGGYSQKHDEGRQYLQKQLGDKVETTYVENVPEGADAERVFEDLVQKGNKLIFGTSFGFMDAEDAVAKRHPDVIFMHCSGYTTEPNMGTYFGRNHDAWYLSGVVAGASSKTGKMGFVGAFPIPEVVRAINAFTLGAQSVNPNATVKVVWSNTWYDPAKEKQAAESLLDVGADLLAAYQDSPATLQAAQARGKFSIGNDIDSHAQAPKSFLTSAAWNWGPYYVQVANAVLNHTWKSDQYWGTVKDGITDIVPVSDVAPLDAKTKADAAHAKIVSGELVPFTGPIKDQSGKEKVAAGVKLTDKELLSMDWFVKGVDGTIPKQ